MAQRNVGAPFVTDRGKPIDIFSGRDYARKVILKGRRHDHQHPIKGAKMIQLSDKENGTFLGTISEEDLRFLIDNLEEEWAEDTDYYLNRTTFDMLKNKGAGQSLLDILEPVFKQREDIEIEWSRSK